MSRIELWMTVLAGVAGGLAGVLWYGMVTSPWLARHHAGPGGALPDSAARLLAFALLRGAAGAALGFLFWLGWGLIALVGQPWPAVGLLFGGLSWAAVALPLLVGARLRGLAPAPVLAALATEWLLTCLAIGLLCAYSWHRYA